MIRKHNLATVNRAANDKSWSPSEHIDWVLTTLLEAHVISREFDPNNDKHVKILLDEEGDHPAALCGLISPAVDRAFTLRDRLIRAAPENVEWLNLLRLCYLEIASWESIGFEYLAALTAYQNAFLIGEVLVEIDPENAAQWQQQQKEAKERFNQLAIDVEIGVTTAYSSNDLIQMRKGEKSPVLGRGAPRRQQRQPLSDADHELTRPTTEDTELVLVALKTDRAAMVGVARQIVARKSVQEPSSDELKLRLERLEAEAVELRDGTLINLISRYKSQRNITLPPNDARITDPKQAKAAAGLNSTFKNLQARLTRHGLDPLPSDELVLKAQRQSVAFYRSRTTPDTHDHV